MRTPTLTLRLLALLGVAAAWATPAQAEWQDVATISNTLGNTAGRLCMGAGGTDFGCPTAAPYLDTAGGLLTVPGDLRVIGNFYVSGSQSIDGVTFANGGVSATGVISATSFAGDGSNLTNVTASSVDWYNISQIPAPVQAVSNGTVLTMEGLTATSISATGGLTAPSATFTNATVTTATITSLGAGAINAASVSATTVSGSALYAGNGLIYGDLTIRGNLNVSGSQSIDGVTFANGGVSATGVVTATSFAGDGSQITNIDAANITGLNTDRITSGTTNVLTTENASITLTTAGTERMVIGTNGNVGIGTSNPTSSFSIYSTNPQIRLTDTDTGADNFINASSSAGALNISADENNEVIGSYLGLRVDGDWAIFANEGRLVGVGTTTPSTTLHVSGTLRIADGNEDCDANRTGAMRYNGGEFYVCRNGSNWESLTSIANAAASNVDRITSGTTAVVANTGGTISLTTGGVTTGYFNTAGNLVAPGISLTNAGISSTNGYFAGTVGINRPSPAGLFEVGNPASPNDAIIIVNDVNVGMELRSGDSNGQPYIDFANDTGSDFDARIQLISDNALTFQTERLGVNTSFIQPSTTLHVSGTLRIADAGEDCDANRTGAMRYNGGEFYVCRNGSSWESLTSIANAAASNVDRITSGTTAVTANTTGTISLTTGGVTTGYFDATGRLVAPGISTTTGNVHAAGSLRAGNADTTCSGSADYGKMRFNEATGRMYLCRP